MSALEELDLSSNQLSGPIPADLGRLGRLERFEFAENILVGVLPIELADLASRSSFCTLESNAESLCLPTAPPYDQFPSNLCGLTAMSSCQPQILSNIDSFNARQDGERLVLEWEVDVASNVLKYRVEQLLAGDFVELGLVDGSETQNYQFVLTNPQNGKSLFRIQILDPSGSVKNGPELEVVFIPMAFLIEGPYPNPASDRTSLTVAIATPSGVKIDLVDNLGREVKNFVNKAFEAGVQELIDLDLTSLSAGLFFLRIQSDQGSRVMPIHVVK